MAEGTTTAVATTAQHHSIAASLLSLVVVLSRLILGVYPKLVVELKALGKELRDIALTFGDVTTDHELAIHTHVVDGVELLDVSNCSRHYLESEKGILTYLHAVRVQLSRRGDTPRVLDLLQAALEGQ